MYVKKFLQLHILKLSIWFFYFKKKFVLNMGMNGGFNWR